jgi:hypothetical protein
LSDTDTQPDEAVVDDDDLASDGEDQNLDQVRAALKRANKRNRELRSDAELARSLRQNAEEARDHAVEAERTVRTELAFTRAGIDLDSFAGQAFQRTYDGDPLDPEALSDAWDVFRVEVARAAGIDIPIPDEEPQT